jgi:hypothetical protein
MLRQIAALSRSQNSAMQRSLRALDKEAQELQEAGEKLVATNPQLEQTLRSYREVTNTTAVLINANDTEIQNSGAEVGGPATTAKVFRPLAAALIAQGLNPLQNTARITQAAERQGLIWNAIDIADIVRGFTSTDEWGDRLSKWGDGYADLAEETIQRGLQSGWGPIRTARELRKQAENIPVSAAENLTRTLQLTSYRRATAASELANDTFIEKKIRVAKLDNRTCLTCIDLHGTELDAGEEVVDHYNGRCDSIYIIPGVEPPDIMQADSRPGQRNFVPFQTGPEWFNSLPENRQREQASFQKTPAKFEAFKAGTPLSAFVKEHTDAVFGLQVVEDSLIGAIGGAADDFYVAKPANE